LYRTNSYSLGYMLMEYAGQYYCGYKTFFAEHTHQTKIGPHLSVTATFISGVIQGSGVGLMFLVYINELATVLEKYGIKIILFADDVKLYVQILNDIHVVQLAAAKLSML